MKTTLKDELKALGNEMKRLLSVSTDPQVFGDNMRIWAENRESEVKDV